MLILHISDIHFKAPQCASDNDPNRPYRTRMIQDARNRCDQMGNVDAIIIGGDIAYRADPIEYAAAKEWITELAQTCGCPVERIFVVPGNHDVDRGIIQRKRNIQNAQAAISSAEPSDRADELMAQLTDESVGHALVEPMSAYNDFAKMYDCQVFPKRLFWKQDLFLRDDVKLRLYGLTSTLLSGAVNARGRQDDTRDSLFLSHWQTVFDPVEDVVNAVISHHPPDWFMDHDTVEEACRGRTKLQFFGHRHRQGNIRDPNYMRFEAGALNPDRNETEWHPAYNLIKLKVEGEGAERQLHISARFMTWQAGAPEQYICLLDNNGAEVWEHPIAIPGRARLTAAAGPAADPQADSNVQMGPATNQSEEVAMNDVSMRKIVTRWWRLPMDARREIALKLNLITEAEIDLPEAERYGLALARAGENHQVDALIREIEKWENQ